MLWSTIVNRKRRAHVARYIRCSDILSGDEQDDCTVSRDPEGGMQVEGCEVKAIRRSTGNRSVVQEAWWMRARSGSRKSWRSWNARRFAAVSRGPSSRPPVSRVAANFSFRAVRIVDGTLDPFENLSEYLRPPTSYRVHPVFAALRHIEKVLRDFQREKTRGNRCGHRLW